MNATTPLAGELPALRPSDHPDFVGGWVWTEMEIVAIQAYARQAIAAALAREPEPEALTPDLVEERLHAWRQRRLNRSGDYFTKSIRSSIGSLPKPKGIEHLLDLVSEYWDIAHAEGREGRTHDTEEGAASSKWNEIRAEARALASRDVPREPEQPEQQVGMLSDAERLDWLDNYRGADTNISLWKTISLGKGAWMVDVGNGDDFEGFKQERIVEFAKTVREAIDAAVLAASLEPRKAQGDASVHSVGAPAEPLPLNSASGAGSRTT